MKSRYVIVLDQHGTITRQLKAQEISDIEFHYAVSVADGKRLLSEEQYSVGLVVFDSPPLLQQEDVEQLARSASMTEWIALVAPFSQESVAFQTFLLAAFYDYHTLPIDLHRLLLTIGRAHGKSLLRLSLRKKRGEEPYRLGMLGDSSGMRAFFMQLEKTIEVDCPVLIGGETGTGKELVAQAIHKHSKRSGGPFVVINCGAIPENLIQSELFGHEKGAFTGADQRKIGSIEAANGGVLFFDEIGDLPLLQQVNLLRFIQERTITRLGSTQVIPVDCRIIAATHIDLQEAIRVGRFREDLYYRLNVVHLNLPALRHRHDDVWLLAENIFQKYSTNRTYCRAQGFSTEALSALKAYQWPGNVRELMNRVHRAAILSESKLISAADLGLEAPDDESQSPTLESARASTDRIVLEHSLRKHKNNVSKAARELGVSRVTFYRMMSKHNVDAMP